MTTLYWGMLSEEGVPQELEKVARNTYPVNPTAPPKELPGPPDWNQLDSDPDPELGFTSHQLGSDWNQPEKYAPDTGTATAEHDQIVNRRIATSGTAAAREAAGEYGHGTMGYAVGIEPAIRDGAEFGTDYFAANRADIGSDSMLGLGIQPSSQDPMDSATAAAVGKTAARDANSASVVENLYRAYLQG